MTHAAYLACGLAAAFAGCVCIYLASPNQAWREASWPSVPARAAGALLLAAGQAALLQPFQAVTGVFVLAVWLMLCFVLLPYAAALRTKAGAG